MAGVKIEISQTGHLGSRLLAGRSPVGAWMYDNEEVSNSVEISSGLFRGVTIKAMAKIAPTASIDLDNNAILGVLTELEIPIGCILKIERLPQMLLTSGK